MRALAALLLLAAIASGDGKFFSNEVAAVAIPDQSALLVWDDGRETLVISSAFVGEGTEFAWLIPLPAPPAIEPSTAGLFPTLRGMTAPDVRQPASVPLVGHIRPASRPAGFQMHRSKTNRFPPSPDSAHHPVICAGHT